MKVDGPRPDKQRRNLAFAAALLVQLLATHTNGQALEEVHCAPDISVTLGGTGVGAGVLATDDLSGGVTVLAIPNLPAAASISAAHRFANGDLLVAFDSTLSLLGAGIVEPRDLVRFTSATQMYSVPVRGADVGIPGGARIDALAVTGAGTVLLSLDVSVGAFDDEDVVRIDGTGLVLFLDLSAVGIAQSLDLDGLDVEENGTTRLYVSFDGSSTVDAVAFDDEDIPFYDLMTQAWALAYDGSATAAQWPAAADLIALDVALAAPPTATPTPTSPVITSTATATSSAPAATDTATATATLPASTSTATVIFTPAGTATATATAPDATGTATATATGPATTATVTATGTLSPTVPVLSTVTTTATATVEIPCPGDCNGSGEVTIDELILMVNIALGSRPLSACQAGDLDNSGSIAVNELVAAVGNALFGCP